MGMNKDISVTVFSIIPSRTPISTSCTCVLYSEVRKLENQCVGSGKQLGMELTFSLRNDHLEWDSSALPHQTRTIQTKVIFLN